VNTVMNLLVSLRTEESLADSDCQLLKCFGSAGAIEGLITDFQLCAVPN
jgi:hypothetical protein